MIIQHRILIVKVHFIEFFDWRIIARNRSLLLVVQVIRGYAHCGTACCPAMCIAPDSSISQATNLALGPLGIFLRALACGSAERFRHCRCLADIFRWQAVEQRILVGPISSLIPSGCWLLLLSGLGTWQRFF